MADLAQGGALDQPLPVPQNDDGKYTVQVNGVPVHFDQPPSVNDIDHAAQAYKDQSSILGDAWNSVKKGAYGVGQAFGDVIRAGQDALGIQRPDSVPDSKQMDTTYKSYLDANPDLVKSYSDISNAHDLGLYAAERAARVLPYGAAYLAGGAPLVAATAGVQGGDEESKNPDATPLSVGTAGAVNAAAAAVPAPLLKFGGSIPAAIARNALAGAGLGAGQAAVAGIPRAVATGNPDDAIPSAESIKEGALSGLIGGGVLGAGEGIAGRTFDIANKAVTPGPDRTAPVDVTDTSGNPSTNNALTPQQRADSALQDRLQAKAGDDRVTASNSNSLLDDVHSDIASEINGLKGQLKDSISTSLADSLDDLLDRAGVNATLKDGVNKVKGDVSEDDISQLLDRPTGTGSEALGDTQEGRQLADLLRQSQSLSELARGSQLGGLAKYTSILNPISNLLPGGDRSPWGMLRDLPVKGAMGALGVAEPATFAATVAPDLIARGVGRLGDATGLFPGNSKVNNFMSANAGATPPIDMSGARSMIADNTAQAQQAAVLQQAQQALAAHQAQTKLAMQQQNQAATIQAQQQSILQKVMAAHDAQQQAQVQAQQQAAAAKQAAEDQALQDNLNQTKLAMQQQKQGAAIQKQQGSAIAAAEKQYNAEQNAPLEDLRGRTKTAMTQMKQAAAIQKQQQQAINAASSRMNARRGSNQPTAEEAAELHQTQALRAAKMARNDPGFGGFDKIVFDRTGLKPQEAYAGVQQLLQAGEITPAQHDAWLADPSKLMKNNVGNMIIDSLAHMSGHQPVGTPASATIDPLRSLAYAATAKGNQARITGAMDRIAHDSNLSEGDAQMVNEGIAALSTTNNKADASSIARHVYDSVGPEAKDAAMREIEPLIAQIRHDTPQQAQAAFQADSADAHAKATSLAETGPTKAALKETLGEHAPRFQELFNQQRDVGKSYSDAQLYAYLKLSEEVLSGK